MLFCFHQNKNPEPQCFLLHVLKLPQRPFSHTHVLCCTRQQPHTNEPSPEGCCWHARCYSWTVSGVARCSAKRRPFAPSFTEWLSRHLCVGPPGPDCSEAGFCFGRRSACGVRTRLVPNGRMNPATKRLPRALAVGMRMRMDALEKGQSGTANRRAGCLSPENDPHRFFGGGRRDGWCVCACGAVGTTKLANGFSRYWLLRRKHGGVMRVGKWGKNLPHQADSNNKGCRLTMDECPVSVHSRPVTVHMRRWYEIMNSWTVWCVVNYHCKTID